MWISSLFRSILILVCSLESTLALTDVGNKEYLLYKDLFQNYSKSTRPTKSWNDQMNVSMNINILKIANVIENHQTMTIYAALELVWLDSNLVWNPQDYDKIDSMNIPADRIWVPDLHLFNSASEDDRIYPLNVEIMSNGTVQSYPISQLYAHCDFDFADFPYDTQSCEFIIGTVIEKSKLKLNLNVNGMASRMLPNQEWKFLRVQLAESDWILTVPGSGNGKLGVSADWSVNKFTIDIKRTPDFYVNLFVWPCIFILFVAMSMFILPPTCVERVTMGVLLLLTMVFMSLMLDSYTPKSATSVSLVSRLIGFTMFMIAWSTIASSIVVILDRDRFTYVAIPMWIKTFLLKYVGKLICRYGTLRGLLMSNQITRDEEIEILDPNRILSGPTTATTAPTSQLSDQITTGAAAAAATVATIATTTSSTDSLADMNQAKTMLVLINNQLAMMRIKAQEKDGKEQNKKDWHVVACAFDRLFLLTYALIMFMGLFVIFV